MSVASVKMQNEMHLEQRLKKGKGEKYLDHLSMAQILHFQAVHIVLFYQVQGQCYLPYDRRITIQVQYSSSNVVRIDSESCIPECP